ncbi:MAG: vWA domain-containing protein [Armatimonadota bacterium]
MAFKLSSADTPGRDDDFTGEQFLAPVIFSLSGIVKGTTWDDLEDKIHALRLACVTPARVPFYRTADRYRMVQVIGQSGLDDSAASKLRTAAMDFELVMKGDPYTESDTIYSYAPGTTGIDVLYVLDVSPSMDEAFPGSTSKMQAAKDAIIATNATLAAGSAGNRAGLITFSNIATTAADLSGDFAALNALVQSQTSASGTDTAEGITLAQTRMAATRDPANQTILILITDGAANDVPAAEAAAQTLKDTYPGWFLYAVAINSGGFNTASMQIIGNSIGDGYSEVTTSSGTADAIGILTTIASTVEGTADSEPTLLLSVTVAPGGGRVLLINTGNSTVTTLAPTATGIYSLNTANETITKNGVDASSLLRGGELPMLLGGQTLDGAFSLMTSGGAVAELLRISWRNRWY